MKAKVEEDESLAQAYGDIVSADKSVDDEIEAALGGSSSAAASDKLAELKQKMGIS
jgi:phage shock protein A